MPRARGSLPRDLHAPCGGSPRWVDNPTINRLGNARGKGGRFRRVWGRRLAPVTPRQSPGVIAWLHQRVFSSMDTSVLIRNNVRVFGQGTQPMLFAHGFGCDQNMW